MARAYKPSVVRRRIVEIYLQGTDIPFGQESIRMIKRRYQNAIQSMYPTPLAVGPEIYAEHFYRLMGFLFGNPNEPFQPMKPDFFSPNHWNALLAWYTPTKEDKERHQSSDYQEMGERIEFKAEVRWMCNRAHLAEVYTQRALRNYQRRYKGQPNEPQGPFEPIPHALKRPIPWLSELIYEMEYTMDGSVDPGIIYPEGGMVEFAMTLGAEPTEVKPAGTTTPPERRELTELPDNERILRELGFGAWLDTEKR